MKLSPSILIAVFTITQAALAVPQSETDVGKPNIDTNVERSNANTHDTHEPNIDELDEDTPEDDTALVERSDYDAAGDETMHGIVPRTIYSGVRN